MLNLCTTTYDAYTPSIATLRGSDSCINTTHLRADSGLVIGGLQNLEFEQLQNLGMGRLQNLGMGRLQNLGMGRLQNMRTSNTATLTSPSHLQNLGMGRLQNLAIRL